MPPGRTLEIGCGYGTDAFYLDKQGFEVVATDVSPTAIGEARRRAESQGATVDFRVVNVLEEPGDLGGSFDFLFDRGVYHILRNVDLLAYLRFLERVSQPGTLYLTLSGNTNDPHEGEGPPKVAEEAIRSELGGLFEILDLHEFRWDESPQMGRRPLGWSTLMRRR